LQINLDKILLWPILEKACPVVKRSFSFWTRPRLPVRSLGEGGLSPFLFSPPQFFVPAKLARRLF